MNIDIVPIPLPASAEAPTDPLYEAYAHVRRADDLEFFGNEDLVNTARDYHIADADQTYERTQKWVAFPAGERAPEAALALAAIDSPMTDNTHLSYFHVVTHPEHRSQGIASQLYSVVEAALRESGRTSFQVWTNHHPYAGADALTAKTGVGHVDPASPAARWLSRLGFDLEQTERHSVLELPADGDHWWQEVRVRQERDQQVAGDEYELVQWEGRTPPGYLANYARLRERMSVDIPSGELDFEEEKWDEKRVDDMGARREAMGHRAVMTCVRHIPSGELVAYTELVWPGERPAGTWQWDTFVHGEHRGHRLGAIVKAANLFSLREANPAAERIHTWNAGENSYMLSINVELGFAASSVEAAWQKRV